MKKAHILTAKCMLKLRPYYSEEELRRMTNEDITDRLIALSKKQKYKFEVDVNALNDEMQVLKKELEKRQEYKHIVIVDEQGVVYCECSNDYKELQKKIYNKEVSFFECDNALNTLKETFFAYKTCGFSIEDLQTIVNEFNLFLSAAEEREKLGNQ